MSSDLNAEQIEIIQEFIQEVRDLIDELEPNIVDLGQLCQEEQGELGDDSKEMINGLFRLFHSIKGAAGFLEFNHIASTTHTAENLLDAIRTGAIHLVPKHIDLLCVACDFTKDALDYVESNFEDSGMEDHALEVKEKFADKQQEEAIGQEKESESEHKNDDTPKINLDISPEELIGAETIQQFIQEAEEQLQSIEDELLKWKETPEDTELIASLFRSIHTFKGNCGFLGYQDPEKLAHRIESVLDVIKSGKGLNTERVANLFLQLVDTLSESLEKITSGGKGEIVGLDMYLDLVGNLLPEGMENSEKKVKSESEKEAESSSALIGDILVEQRAITKDDVEEILHQQRQPVGELLVKAGKATDADIEKALETQAKRKKTAPAKPAALRKREAIRVDLDKLDSLINLIGEMVIAENMIINNPDIVDLELENFSKASQHMTKIIRELQEMAMTIRMIPISGLFRRMIRLVHDLSRKSGKKVDLRLTGESTEVDKTVIEKITDPLVHLLRNSMDHGLEMPEDRNNAGKDETGVVALSAAHEEGEVLITIKDDGNGLNREKLLAKAIEKGLVEGDGSQMSDREVYSLIFKPGFSTADQITDISGRGVGMDVVRQNLEAINGKIDVESIPGQGTTIILRIPLTMAIIDGMLLRTGTSKYILPILAIKESFQPAPNAITVSPDGQELVKVRENLLPIIRLHKIHNVKSDYDHLSQGILVVVEGRESTFCLYIDELLGQQQTVIKGLSDYINKTGDVGGVSGCTILGDGDVCLILDVRSLEELI
jgi:two-component system, chemotaxis family, sensor kinase CheA